MKRWVSLVLAVPLLLSLGAQEPKTQTPSVRPKPESFKNYDDYIEALVDWKIQKLLPGILQQARAAVVQSHIQTEAAYAPSNCVPAIKGKIRGDFKGWDGHTVYELDNGQIWKQTTYHYHYHYAYSPDVMIYAASSGCQMKVEDDDDEGATVTRVR